MHELMRKQQESGHEVHAVSTRSLRNLPTEDERFFVTRYNLDKREGARKDIIKAVNYIWNIEAKDALERALDELKPDVVHLHNLYHHLSTSVLKPIRERNLPCVQTLHDYKLACPNYRMFTEGSPCERCKGGNYFNAVKHRCLASGLLPNLLAAFEMGMTKSRQSYEKTVHAFLCPSRFIKEKMEDWGEPKDKFHLLPNPTDLPEAPAPRGGGFLLYVGSLSEVKGVASLIKASAQVPELPLKLAGRGPEQEHLKSLAKSLGAHHIEFLGFTPPAELAVIRQRAEAVVLPTLSYENCSGALLEGMADGLPCLATRIGGNPELIEDGVNGFLAQPGNVEDWVRTIRRFQAASKEVRDQMGEEGRRRIKERHFWPTHVEGVLELYRLAQSH